MATMRGQRFHVDLSSDSDDGVISPSISPMPPAMHDLGVIKDVVEHAPSFNARPPSPPTLKSSETGFPAHKQSSRRSDWRRRREDTATSGAANPSQNGYRPREATDASIPFAKKSSNAISTTDRKQIDEENKQRLAKMSPQEIEEEKRELLAGLSQSTIERLFRRANMNNAHTGSSQDSVPSQPTKNGIEMFLKRANIDEDQTSTIEDPLQAPYSDDVHVEDKAKEPVAKHLPPQSTNSVKKVAFTEEPDRAPQSPSSPDHQSPTSPPSSTNPKPPPPPLDPSSPSFLSALHATYFPSLPQNPSTLSWLSPLPEDDPSSPYHPAQASFPVSSLRFDFRGLLLPPALSQQIPVTKGLHHHGIAPEAAGYTLEELSMLMRSSVTAQRCVGVQTAGRVLFRLGRGDFGHMGVGRGNDEGGEEEEEDAGETLCRGMWNLVERLKVIDMLIVEANKEEGKGSRTLRVLALEAVWLWQRGGGNRWMVRAQ